MLTTKAIFARKENWFEPQDCMIEKIVELSAEDYKAFSQNMLRDHDFIADNIDSMCVDENGIWHGMLVLDGGSNNAILVESEGSKYARYASFLPSFKPYVESQILQLADLIIKDGTQKTADGNWAIGFDDIQERFGVTVIPDNGTCEMLARTLNMSDEVAELELSENGFGLTYYLDYCENLDEKHRPSRKPIIKLADMLSCNFEDVHLCHKEVENEPVTICELNNSTLTTEGKQEWADVLKADVCRIYDGYYGLQIELSGVKPSRLDAFSGMLVGICSQENYEKWVMQEQEPSTAMTMKQE